jgi:Ca2+-binding RTX toxin-like protein
LTQSVPIRFATAIAAACLLVAPALAGAAVTAQVDGDGTLTLGGDAASDRYGISCAGGLVTINGFDPDTGPTPCAQVAAFHGDTGPGDDTVDLTAVSAAAGFTHPTLNSTTDPSSILIALGPGADIGYLGAVGGDFLGLGGNDQLLGGDGRDRLKGGAGSDMLRGRRGRDSLEAGDNNDGVFGGPGRDDLYGDAGADRILGGPGADLMFGLNGGDALFGGAGRDSAYGHRGRDRCRAEARHLCEF